MNGEEPFVNFLNNNGEKFHRFVTNSIEPRYYELLTISCIEEEWYESIRSLFFNDTILNIINDTEFLRKVNEVLLKIYSIGKFNKLEYGDLVDIESGNDNTLVNKITSDYTIDIKFRDYLLLKNLNNTLDQDKLFQNLKNILPERFESADQYFHILDIIKEEGEKTFKKSIATLDLNVDKLYKTAILYYLLTSKLR